MYKYIDKNTSWLHVCMCVCNLLVIYDYTSKQIIIFMYNIKFLIVSMH